jgi:hypothetical protein
MLTGRLPYGARIAKIRTRAQQRKLVYISARNDELHIPGWIDGALKKITHPDPLRRHDTLTEFLADLRIPNQNLVTDAQTPLVERNPVAFWQAVSLVLAVIIVALLLG